MSRIILDIPESLPFSTEIPIRVTDLNYGGHLGNDKVLTLVQEARTKFFGHCGLKELNNEGVSFVVGDAAIQYKAEGFYGQTICIHVGANEFSRRTFDLYYRLEILNEDRILAFAKTGIVCFDFDIRKSVSLPDWIRKKLELNL